MKLRLIVKTVHTCPEGMATGQQYKTAEVDCPPELEKLLRTTLDYVDTSIVGAEIVEQEKQP